MTIVARLWPKLIRVASWIIGIVGGYVLVSYLAVPAIWRHYEHQHRLDGLPMVTATAQDIPGDPINIGFAGTKTDILCAMKAAGWVPADAITFRSSLEISESVALDRPYPDAPVSNLFYSGRKQDLAFEKPAGSSPDTRNHLRLWQVLKEGREKRPVWLGSATFDRSVGLSRYTGEVTHHIAPDIDLERARVERDLQDAGMIAARYQVTGVGPTLRGRNGGGDPYFTDGEVWIMRLVEDCKPQAAPPELLPSPPAAQFKDFIWRNVASLYRQAK